MSLFRAAQSKLFRLKPPDSSEVCHRSHTSTLGRPGPCVIVKNGSSRYVPPPWGLRGLIFLLLSRRSQAPRLGVFMNSVVLHRIDLRLNMARFYRLDVQPELFGGWTLIREWGRIGRSGTVKALRCPSEAEALVVLERRRRAKERRGYNEPVRRMSPQNNDFWCEDPSYG
jgi:predicted DNA-binding WGR domain protein